MIVTVTLSAVTEAYSPVPLTAWLRITALIRSRVFVLGRADGDRLGLAFQFSDVKVRVSALRFRSVSVCPLMVTVTSALGWVSSTIV